MENQKKKFIAPPNNKALYHTLSNVLADVLNDEMPLEKADRIVSVSKAIQKSLEIELQRAKVEYIIGNDSIRLREIEIKMAGEDEY